MRLPGLRQVDAAHLGLVLRVDVDQVLFFQAQQGFAHGAQ